MVWVACQIGGFGAVSCDVVCWLLNVSLKVCGVVLRRFFVVVFALG